MNRREIFKGLTVLGLGTIIAPNLPDNKRQVILVDQIKPMAFTNLRMGHIFKFADDYEDNYYIVLESTKSDDRGLNSVKVSRVEKVDGQWEYVT